MGKKPRQKPKRLAEKLSQIRAAFGVSQSELLRRLGVGDEIDHTMISKYELGRNEPTLLILLRYARVAGVHVETLIDDKLDLPDKIPARPKHK